MRLSSVGLQNQVTSAEAAYPSIENVGVSRNFGHLEVVRGQGIRESCQ